jgi:hypothetical protein
MRDSDVRAAVRSRLHNQYACDPETRIVEEMGVWSGSVRIDVAVINGELTGYELKSERDTLERLPTQADIYSRVFDRMELVVGERHVEKAARVIPCWWGITVASQKGELVELVPVRPGAENPSPEPYLIAQLLWKSEAISVMESVGMAKGWRNKPVRAIHERLASELAITQLKRYVRSILKNRVGWLGKVRPD